MMAIIASKRQALYRRMVRATRNGILSKPLDVSKAVDRSFTSAVGSN
jgi:hypothetical protein